MGSTMTTSSPPARPTSSDLAFLSHLARRRAPTDKVEIKTGSLAMFRARVEHEKIGPPLDDPKSANVGVSYCGIAVRQNILLPQDRAVLLVNDEVTAIIDLKFA